MLYKLLSLISVQVFAQTDYVPLEDSLPSAITYETNDLSGFLIGWFTVLVMAVTVLAVVWIVLGGIQYMSTDAYSGKSEGKKKITNALVGLLLAGLSWLILATINPNILDINLNYTGKDTTGDSWGAVVTTSDFVQKYNEETGLYETTVEPNTIRVTAKTKEECEAIVEGLDGVSATGCARI